MKFIKSIYLMFNIKKYYQQEAEQRLSQVNSDYAVIKSASINRTKEQEDAINEIDRLCQDAETKSYTQIWSRINQIEQLMVLLFDNIALYPLAIKLKNNTYLLHETDRVEWDKQVEKIIQPGPTIDPAKDNEIRSLLRRLSAEIAEARRVNFMTTELKRALLGRFLFLTLFSGVIVALVFCFVLGYPSVLEAVLLGVLGGFFSRILAIKDLDYKPPAFTLMAMYNYVQASLGGIGALVLYIILISPLGPEVLSEKIFYSADTTVTAPSHNPVVNDSSSVFLTKDTTKIQRPRTPTGKMPNPSAVYLLSFLAGFSERWLLGTLEGIIGKKLAKADQSPPVEKKI